MGLHKQYLKVGQSAKNRLFGVKPMRKTPASSDGASPIQMLISEQGKINHGRLAVIVIGLFTLAIGIILSSIPWLDYIILKNLRLMNGSLSYHYWQKPGVIRLTKLYIFNVTNVEGFLNGEKPKIDEIGPFVYREDMEKVNIKFHENDTVTYQHNKILQFIPELSVDRKTIVTVPNIPLLTLTTQGSSMNRIIQMSMSLAIRGLSLKPFVTITAEEFIFGYDNMLTKLANTFYPKNKRPHMQMGLLLGRNGTLKEVSTIYTGHTTMEDFGLLNRLNGMDKLPYWPDSPCNYIRASEGTFFPPRKYTKSDIVYIYDKDLCRIWPLQFRNMVYKDGIEAGYYTPRDDIFDLPQNQPDNKCYCGVNEETCPAKGLQNISPCQFGAPAYLSFPHFYQADPALLEEVEGLKPEKEKHESYFMIQSSLGVPLEGQIRVQLNLKVDHAPHIHTVSKFRAIVFPIVWLQEDTSLVVEVSWMHASIAGGALSDSWLALPSLHYLIFLSYPHTVSQGVQELTPGIRRWVYLATTVGETAEPIVSYGLLIIGILILTVVFVKAYKNVVFTKETIAKGKETLRRGSSFIINGQHRLLIIRDSYTLLNNVSTDPEPDRDQDHEV